MRVTVWPGKRRPFLVWTVDSPAGSVQVPFATNDWSRGELFEIVMVAATVSPTDAWSGTDRLTVRSGFWASVAEAATAAGTDGTSWRSSANANASTSTGARDMGLDLA